MKKILVPLLVLLISSLACAEQSEEKLSKFIEFDMSSSTTRGIEREERLFAGEAGLNAHWFDAITGIQLYEDAFDFTAAGEVWLPFANWYFDEARLVLGVGGLYHFQRYKDISSEHDWILDTCFRYHSYTGFTFTFRGGYSWKATRIDELAEFVPLIYDRYPSGTLRIEKVFSNGFEIYYEHMTHDLYRYPVFCTPTYMLGCAINLESGLRFGGDVALRICDGYTTAPYVDGLILRLTARYTF